MTFGLLNAKYIFISRNLIDILFVGVLKVIFKSSLHIHTYAEAIQEDKKLFGGLLVLSICTFIEMFGFLPFFMTSNVISKNMKIVIKPQLCLQPTAR